MLKNIKKYTVKNMVEIHVKKISSNNTVTIFTPVYVVKLPYL